MRSDSVKTAQKAWLGCSYVEKKPEPIGTIAVKEM